MSKHARALVFGAMLAAMNLAGMTAIAQAQAAQDDAIQRFRRGERAAQEQPTIADNTQRPPTEAQVGESWRHPVNVPVPPAEPSGQSGWLVLTLGVLSAALALVAGLAVLVARRTSRRLRAGHAA